MSDSQQLLDSEEEKQAEINVVIQCKIRLKKHKIRNNKKKSQLWQDIDREILKALSSSNTAPHEDEAFFISVIPAVWRTSKEEKLDFRMSALQLIKDIKHRRKEKPVFETTFSHATTSKSRTTTPHSSLSAIMDTNQVSQLPNLLQAGHFSYHPECNSSSNVKTTIASGYTFQFVWNYFLLISLHVLWSVNKLPYVNFCYILSCIFHYSRYYLWFED